MDYSLYFWIRLLLQLALPVLIIIFLHILRDRDDRLGVVFENQKWNLYDILICVLIIDCSFFVSFLLKQWRLIQLIVFWSLNVFAFYFVFRLKLRQSLAVLGIFKKGLGENVFYGLKTVLLVNIFFYGWAQLSPRPEQWLKWSHGVFKDLTVYQHNLYVVGFLLVIAILIGPLVEELIFRGLIYTPFRRKVGKWGAILLTSIVFALYHGQIHNIFGVIFAYMYEKRRSLLPSFVCHSFLNMFFAINFVYTTNFLRLSYSVDYRYYAKTMFLVCLVIFLIILFIEKILPFRKE